MEAEAVADSGNLEVSMRSLLMMAGKCVIHTVTGHLTAAVETQSAYSLVLPQ